MTLIDTTSILGSQLRGNADPALAGEVQAFLREGVAASCPSVEPELWGGNLGGNDRLG
jgi:hypothetical protein